MNIRIWNYTWTRIGQALLAPRSHHRPTATSSAPMVRTISTFLVNTSTSETPVVARARVTRRDMYALGISYTYAGSLMGLAEAIRHWRGYPQDFTRKIVHIGAGMWVFGVLALFETWYVGVSVFASFVLLNYLSYRYRLLRSIDTNESSPGTVYFALSISLLFLYFWRTNSPSDRAHIAASAAMTMTWGDALAALIGKRWGRHQYTIGGMTRSFEGSAAMFGASAVAIALTLRLLPGSPLAPHATPPSRAASARAAIAGALVATLAEAVSPSGIDNLSVPLLSGVVIAGATSSP